MADFEQVRRDLAAARTATHGASRRLFGLRQQLSRLERRRRRLQRTGGPSPDGADPAGGFAIDRRIAALEGEIEGRARELRAAKETEGRHLAAFVDFTDPRENLGNLSDRTPILLLPLRLETRFKAAAELGGERDELWVRVYPDDVSVDVFEDTVSEDEAQRARTYWADVWRAGGVEADERGAWRVLVSGQGSGRSHWVIRSYRPLNEAERPVKAEGVPTVILTVATRAPLVEPERTVVGDFWTALWFAGDDGDARAAALDALRAELGAARADEIVREYKPRNLADPPPGEASREATTVVVAFLDFPDDDAAGLREASWSQAPRVTTLPDRLVLLGYVGGQLAVEQLGRPIPSPLAVGPDPSAEEDEQIRPVGGDLQVGDEMAWVTDFERAIEAGMGFRVPLTADVFQHGLDHLMVLGVRLHSGGRDGKAELEELIAHHHRSKGGFEVLPQGRPTNNVEGQAAAYSWQEDPDVSFDHYFGAPEPDPDGWFEKRDGRWLAEMLGLDPAALRSVPFYRRTDVADALAMNVALWPGTLGYFMETMLHPVFDPGTVERAREFFTRYVLARGPIPAVRVGRQPYGILPATARSRIDWFAAEPSVDVTGAGRFEVDSERAFLLRLYGLLRTVESDLEPLLGRVSHLGKPGGDPHQVLLDVVGLHAGSVEFQQRYAESSAHLFNRLRLQGAGGALAAALIALGHLDSGLALLRRLGYVPPEGAETPDLLEKLFSGSPNQLTGGLIDDRPLSESEPIRAYTEAGDNYLTWLIEAASTSHDALRRQEGFVDGPPTALVYLMLHHALDLSFVEIGTRLFFDAGLLDQAQLQALKREPEFFQVREAGPAEAGGPAAAAGRWGLLYRSDAAITGSPERTVGEFIPTVLTGMVATGYLQRQLEALAHLEQRPTAVLERAFAEHLDLCTYRLDAWYGSLLTHRLETLRRPAETAEGEETAGGLYLGAYGWLDEVRPEPRTRTRVELPDDLAEVFDPTADPPLVRDDGNQGYIHAPSLNQAVTAAVLRNGYLSNATPANPGSLAVNLSSERVRRALSIIEGMRGEQSLGALLGYHFERGLHDRHDVEVDEFIYDLRKVFPLVGDRLAPTRTGSTDDLGRPLRIGRIEARNVVDGLALVEHLKSTGSTTYPFGLSGELPSLSAAQAAALNEEAERIADLADAVADLAMAESVHQVVQGNYDRAGAVLDTYSKGKFPATPDVVRTPRSGVTLTHRAALHLEAGLDPADPALTSPRARAEPAIDAWLAGVLPPPAAVACRVTVTDPLDGTVATHTVTQADLGLLPADLLYLLDPDDDPSGRALDDRIEAHVVATHAPRPHTRLAIAYRERIPAIPGHVPFFELAALVRALRGLLLRSRPLRATDLAMSGEATADQDVDVALDRRRITLVRDELAGHLAALTGFHAALQGRLDAGEHAQIATEIDQTIGDFGALMTALEPFARLETGTGSIFAGRRRIFADLLATLSALIERWDGRLDEFDQAIAAYDADPAASDERKFLALRMAERLISTSRTDPLPAQPDDFRTDLVDVGKAAFVAHRDGLAALHGSAVTLSGLHDGIVASKPAGASFDPVEVDLAEPARQVVVLAEDMANRAGALVAEVTARLAAVQARLDAADAAPDGGGGVEALTAAARLLLGEDFQIVPDFALPPAQAAEWGQAWGPGPAADRSILGYLEGDLGRRFPVDDWLTGVARVREKLHRLETAGHLAGAFTGAEIQLQPLQFPHRPGTPWLSLEFPETTPGGEPFSIDEDKLLYTAHYAGGFDPASRQAGLLLDEWTETIPSRTEDTGLAFHYDRPNSEPPQTLLLALSPGTGGGWRWEDLVDAVRETMDLARKRAIEPDHVDTTAYARLLPALISAVTLHPITASLNLAFNNDLAAVLAETEGSGE